MGQVLHSSATTTQAVRRAIQNSQESLRTLAKRYGINQKTVAKWKKRTSVDDLTTGPKNPRSSVLSPEDEAAIVAFRKRTLLPLDDCLYTLQPSIPYLTRSSLHRCLQRHSISRLPEVKGDRPSNFAFTELHTKASEMAAAEFLRNLVKAVPYRIHTVLTDNGIQFTNRTCDRYASEHIFDRVCTECGIEHRLTKVKHPWTNGQVERMNRTIKEATVKRFHYDDHTQLCIHLADFIAAYNFGRRLKTLRGLTPYEFICKQWTDEPELFKIDPIHQMPGLNTFHQTE